MENSTVHTEEGMQK